MTIEQQAIDVVAERDALKAQAEEFRVELDYINSFMAENTDYKLFKELYDWGKRTDLLLLKTPEQCLNSVKAQAYEEGFRYSCSVYNGDSGPAVIKEAVRAYKADNGR